MRFPVRLAIAAALLLLGASFFAVLTAIPIFLMKPGHPRPWFLVFITGVQAVLFLCAGIGVSARTKWASLALGLSAAWYIAIFVATHIHGYVGYAVAVLLACCLWDYNRFARTIPAGNRDQLNHG